MKDTEQLKLLRYLKKVTQEDAAVQLGVSVSKIVNIENGTEHLSKDIIRALVYEWNVSTEWILTGDGDVFQREASDNSEAVVKIPLLRERIDCEPGKVWNNSNSVDCYIEPLNLVPSFRGKNIYAFRHEGLSMVGAGIHDGDIVLLDACMGLEPDDLYVFAWEKKVYCKLLKYNPLDFNLHVYSMHTAKVAEAELVRTINLNTTYDLENFNLFGRVLGWIHENRLVKHEQ